MRKLTYLMIALAICLSIAVPVFATQNNATEAAAQTAASENEGFVPSITYKPSPEIVAVKDDAGNEAIGTIVNDKGEILDYVSHGCLDITPIAHVWDPEEEVPADVERLLTFVYEEINAEKMEIPYEKHEGVKLDGYKMVIRDLFDARWACEEHRAMIEDEGILFEITFDLGVSADTPIYVMTYDEETKEWSPVVKTVNNGDGTVTCTFEHLCAIEFSMPVAAAVAPGEDVTGMPIWPWILILVLAVAAIVVILISKRNKAEEERVA